MEVWKSGWYNEGRCRGREKCGGRKNKEQGQMVEGRMDCVMEGVNCEEKKKLSGEGG